MNEQAIIDSYNLAVQNGYKKSVDEFKTLLSTNSNALNDIYNLSVQNGYKKSIDDYKILMGVSPIKASGQEPEMSAELKKKEDTTALPSALGSLASSESVEPEMAQFGYQPGKPLPEQIPSVQPDQPTQPPYTEEVMFGPMGISGVKTTGRAPEFIGKSIPKVFGEIGKVLAKGAIKSPAGVLETAAIATAAATNLVAKTGLVDETSALNVNLPLGANVNLYQAASEWKDLINDFIPTDKDIESGFWGQVSNALGEMVPIILTGGMSGGAMAIAKEAGKKGISMQAVANYSKNIVSRIGTAQGVLTISQVAAPSYKQAKLEGATENEALGFAIQNAVMTFPLEMLPVNNLFKRLDNVLVGNKGVEILKRAVVGGGEELITEGVQAVYENVTADAIYGTTRGFLDGVGEAAAVGGTVGAIMNGVLTALLGRRARATSDEEIEEIDKSIKDVEKKIAQVDSNNESLKETVKVLEENKLRKLSYGSADYNFIESPKGDLEYADDALTEEQAQGIVGNLANSYKKIDFQIQEVEPDDPYQPTTYKIIGKPKTIQQDAVQEQAAGEVPVQSGATVGQEVEQGVPQAEPQVTTEAGVQEEVVTKKQLPEGVVIESAITEEGEIDYDAEEQVKDIAKKRNLGITSDREIAYVARDADGNVIGGAFTSYDGYKYTFDVVVDEGQEGTGIGSNLLDAVLKMPSDIKDENPKAITEVDVVNPVMQKMLEARGFKVKQKLGEGRVLMRPVAPSKTKKTKATISPAVSSSVSPATEATPAVSQLTQEQQMASMEQMFAEEEAPTTTANQGVSVTNKSAVDNIKTKTTDKQRVKVIESAQRVLKTLKSVLPNFDIVLHDEEGSFNTAMDEIGGAKDSRGNFAIYKDGSGRIDINLNSANSSTVAHEVAHAIMAKAFNGTPELYKSFRDRISKVLNESSNNMLMEFSENYNEDASYEEYLAELTAVLEQQEATLSVNTFQKIAAIINDVVSKLTNGTFKPFQDIKDTKQLVDFFNSISSSIRQGEDIELNGGGEVGTFNFGSKSRVDVKDAPSVANDSRSFIKDLVQDVDIRDFSGKKFVTNMYDYTNAGVTDLGNGFTINMLGGKNYVPYMMSLQDKKIGDVSNLAAFNNKAQAESFARNAIQGQASLFAPHSGTLSESWQFQQHTFAELVNLIIDKKIMSDSELIDVFNKTISSNKDNKKAFDAFKTKAGKDISNFDSFKDNPKQIVDLLDIKNNYSPNLRKALNNAISADKTFQKAIGIKNKEEFFNRIMDPLNDGVKGGEIINVVEFDPKTFQIVQTKAGALDHHPSFGWSILAKINGIYQPTQFYNSSNVTDNYVKYNKSGEEVSRKADEPNFEKKNVSSSAGSIPKVAEFNEPIEKEMPISKAQLIGKNANLSATVKRKLIEAEAMDDNKISPQIIRNSTGWEKGKEGKWRYEIPDGKFKDIDLNDLKKQLDIQNNDAESRVAILGDIFSAPDLFAAYPDAKKITVQFKKLDDEDLGEYIPSQNKINISLDLYNKNKNEAEMTMLHEIQHYIQNIEVFETGSNPKYAEAMMKVIVNISKNLVDKTKEDIKLYKKYVSPIVKEDLNKLTDSYKSVLATYKRMVELSKEKFTTAEKEYIRKEATYRIEEKGGKVDEKILADIFKKLNKKADGYNLYRRVSGEVEAKNVEIRAKMTPEQRRKTLLSETEGFSREDQIMFDNFPLMLQEDVKNIKKEFPVSKSQLNTEAKAKKVVQQARAQGFSEEVIKSFLEGKGVSKADIKKAMAKDVPAAGRITLSEETISGYDSLMGRIENLIINGVDSKEVISKLKNSKTYTEATDVQKEKLVRDVRKMLGLRQKSAPTAKRILGQLKDITKITMTETQVLKKRIKELAEGAVAAKKSIAEANKFLADEIKQMGTDGKITLNQATSLTVRALKMNPLSEASISNFVDYVAKVFSKAEYVGKMTTALAQIKKAKENIKTKIGIAQDLFEPLNQLLSINPTLIPLNQLEKYLGILEDFSARKAVLSIPDRVKVLKQVNEILDEIKNERSSVDALADRFNNYNDKVFNEDGELNYSETIKSMIDKGSITVDEADLMRKYKSEILPQVEKVDLTDAEIEADKKKEIEILKALKIDNKEFPLPSRDEKEDAINLAKLIKELSVEELMNLSLTDLKNIIKVINNINNGYLPHYAKIVVEKLNSIKSGKVLSGSIEKAKPLAFSKLYSRAKEKLKDSKLGAFKKTIDELIRANPLYYIDNVFGDFKTRDIFNSLFEKSAQGLSRFNSELKRVDQKIEAAQNKVLASFTQNPDKYLMSKFRMTTYMLQREYESNVGKKGVKPVADYLKATIKHIRIGNSVFKDADADKLEKILEEVESYTTKGEVDLDKFYNTFNDAEKNAIKVMTEINESLGEKAAYTASVIRGNKVELMDNYFHHNVLHEQSPMDDTAAPEFSNSYSKSMKPSTKAKSLIERTDALTPLNFDLFTSTQKGAKFVLLDYNMTSPIRTARRTLIQAEKNLQKVADKKARDEAKKKGVTDENKLNEITGIIPKQQRDINNAINNAYEEALQNILTNSISQDALGNEVIDFIQKQGYRTALAGTVRFKGELLSNIANALIINPKALGTGIMNAKLIASANGYEFMKNAKSKQTSRLYSSDALSGKLVDPQILKQTSGIKGSVSKGALLNRTTQIYNLTLKKLVQNPVEYIADTMLTTPDKVVSMPLWFGSFMNEFKRITGEEVNQEMMINNDLDYMQKNADAIEQATRKADQESVYSGAANNEFMGVLKGKLKPDQSFTQKAWNNFNSFMTNFMNFDYAAARSAVYNLFNEGYMTKQKAAAVLAGITTRSVIYQVMVANMGAGVVGAALGLAFDWEDEEEVDEKSFFQMLGRGLANVFIGYTVGRNFGNGVRGMINFGVEKINEEYLDFLRNGEYDFYKDNIAYTYVNVGDRGDIDVAKMGISMAGPYTPALNTTVLIGKNFGALSSRVMGEGTTKKEPEAIRREDMTINYRIPLELAGNAGLIPFYKDVKRAVNDEIYKDLRKAANTPDSSITTPDDYDKLKDLKELKNKTKNQEERRAIDKKIVEIVGSEEAKASIDKQKEALTAKKKSLLYDRSGGRRYNNESDMKRLNPALWRKRFGPNSDWDKKTKAKEAVESKLQKESTAREDKEFKKNKRGN
jgi:hypothetical protein